MKPQPMGNVALQDLTPFLLHKNPVSKNGRFDFKC